MKTRRLGNSDMDITLIGLGTFAMGGEGWRGSWGPQDDQLSIKTIRTAADLGINWIDCAAVYGFGHSEAVLGQALKEMPKKPFIFTKCGRRWEKDSPEIIPNLNPDSIRREIDESLSRLGIDVIDLYQIHFPLPVEEIEGAWEVLGDLKRKGKIRWAGVSNFSVQEMERCHKMHPITSLQPGYSLNRRDVEKDVLAYCIKNNIGAITHSTIDKGLLTGKVTAEWVGKLPNSDARKRNSQFAPEALAKLQPKLAVLERIAKSKGASMAHIAIAWIIAQPGVTASLVGARNPEQINDTAKAVEVTLTKAEIDEISKAFA